jgi:phospholipid-binding lipoprotein MlaA
MKKLVLLIFFFVLTTYAFNISVNAEDVPDSKEQPGVVAGNDKSLAEDAANEDEDIDIDEIDTEMEAIFVKDPIQPFNRAMFTFNDKVYYWFFRPLSKGYKTVVPEKARLGVRNFFTNVRMPGRFFNCIFQGKFKGAGTELLRLVINSTLGVGGFSDPATKYFKLEIHDEDFGQTLGRHNVGSGAFLQIPLFGPSNVRDGIGLLGDLVLDPITWLMFVSPIASTGTKSYDTLNEVSIDKGETYEALVEQAIDPYIAVQDAYTQNRIKKIRD